MKWVKVGSRHICQPYQIQFCTRGWGFEVWIGKERLKSAIPYLDGAKAYAAAHKAKLEAATA